VLVEKRGQIPSRTLVGLEILDAKKVLGSGKIPLVTLEGIEPAGAPLVLHDQPAKKYGS